jgi:hypothetical protein
MQRKVGVSHFLFLGLLLFFIPLASAQQLEFGVLVGTTNYSGEVSGFQIRTDMFKPAFGLVTRYNLSPRISLKGSVFYGEIAGADSLSSDKKQKARNLSFQSGIFEFSGQVEFNLVAYNPGIKTGKYHKVIPCIFTGVAIYKYNPKAYYKGQWWELQPLGTEGQGTTQFQDRKKYALTQVAIPIGAGVKFELSKKIGVSFEAGARFTFNDYLDDVSKTYVDTVYIRAAYGPIASALSNRSGETGSLAPVLPGQNRGNKANFDWYYFGGITITFKLSTKRDVCPAIGR